MAKHTTDEVVVATAKVLETMDEAHMVGNLYRLLDLCIMVTEDHVDKYGIDDALTKNCMQLAAALRKVIFLHHYEGKYPGLIDEDEDGFFALKDCTALGGRE